jgi:ribosomal protein S12 methylthiotransferase
LGARLETFHLIGLGCPKNRVDAEGMWAQLARAGLRAVDEPDGADLVVVNTCAFIRPAVEESLDEILAVAALRRAGRCRRLVVAGCLPGRYREALLGDLPEVDLFVGPAEAGRLAELALGPLPGAGGRLVVQPAAAWLPGAGAPRANSLSPGAAYLKVADGCSRRCAFCCIPAIRGPQRSRPLGDVVREAEGLARLGVLELTLVAQDLAAWGHDLPGQPGLEALVAALSGVAGLAWLRLMYLHPREVSDRLLELVASSEKVLPYLDVPLQHVDAGVLRAMRRGGGPRGLLAFVRHLRARVPGLALRTSLMTGFPGESAAAFERLLGFVAEARFERLGVFAFSPEEGTEAAGLKGRVSARVAESRRRRLMELQAGIARDYHASLVGQVVEVLVEGVTGDGTLLGRAWNQAPEVDGETRVRGEATLGAIARVRLTGGDAHDLEGEALD